jgi:hypothetical protein
LFDARALCGIVGARDAYRTARSAEHTMRRINADIVIALLLIVVCAAFFIETFRYQKVHLAIIGSKLWPRVVVTALFFVAIAYLRVSLRVRGAEVNERGSPRRWLAANRNVVFCFAAFAVFLASLPYLGMFIGGALFVFITLTLLGNRDVRGHFVHAAIALLSVGTMWAIFTFGLGVILPQGELLPKF